EIDRIKTERIDEGEEELSDSEIIFSKMGRVEAYTDDNGEEPKSRRYTLVAKQLMDRLKDLRAEIDPSEYDQQNVRENLKKIVDIDNIRSRGFNTAINSITSILDTSRMGYQYIENFKNARELIIREYEETDINHLPDERYQVRMRYYDNAQLIEERKSYDVQIKSFENEVQHLWDVITAIYEHGKPVFRIKDFNDLAAKNKNRIRKIIKEKSGEPLYEDIDKAWDEISFVSAAETDVEKMNRTYIFDKDKLHKKLILMREKLKEMYDYQYPVERRVLEDRLVFLEREYNRFDYMINPYHIEPGLLLDIDITSIKRKKATLDSMANVLNEFLHGVSKGFQDAAFASFSRRRSTVRSDIDQSFESGSSPATAAADLAAPSQAYIDLLNSDDGMGAAAEPSAPAEDKPAPAARTTAKPKAGLVDAKPSKKPAATKPGRRGGRPGGNGLREV
ncbi:MAG: cytochrome C oxidase subunit II, partial [Treponema sp.]|nr:cytochrome C oxidase subunit II [Treponema sp.]